MGSRKSGANMANHDGHPVVAPQAGDGRLLSGGWHGDTRLLPTNGRSLPAGLATTTCVRRRACVCLGAALTASRQQAKMQMQMQMQRGELDAPEASVEPSTFSTRSARLLPQIRAHSQRPEQRSMPRDHCR